MHKYACAFSHRQVNEVWQVVFLVKWYMQNTSSSVRFLEFHVKEAYFKSMHIFSIMLRSKDCGGHSRKIVLEPLLEILGGFQTVLCINDLLKKNRNLTHI